MGVGVGGFVGCAVRLDHWLAQDLLNLYPAHSQLLWFSYKLQELSIFIQLLLFLSFPA